MTTTAPSLMAGGSVPAAAGATPQTLLDLMYDGFYALFMLKNGSGPQNNADFQRKTTQFLEDFTRGAKKQGASADDIDASKYAFCAAVDEIILRSTFSIRDEWERRPLQLVLFGDQLAGENFYHRLEALRTRGSTHLQALEVFHMCLLLGFQGRYILEGSEKLNYLTARLGDEIANMKGKRGGFAPHAERPDQIAHKLRSDLPLWVLCSVFGLICILGYIGLRASLTKSTDARMAAYNDVVKLAPRAATLTITLP
ncbi:type IVB secretion system protein IcmH/DotU [Massilia sp. P8910]|uniref:type IVB secretion system protein IcmH/DotU n=1 Tax=Massilia antarctica TaxID=2765360 RepID=UPI0006BB71CC|nr:MULTISPECIES: type IVB secretion system protein IcmH/DotU [Massilia]MCE3605094.1 type IVB secretion system protein IcmH/DotU [Massilia antarctica]MCY0912646.1 type IVB secretion system protein IcmH/DotU [Massilia sp. H27-R4]CUI03709.1 Probable transmembrane protein [Janthinobacterium sp. CG23_2]CUU27495.1 Probable transmembrane protein [Janthinobacterium sp. CG23_2]